MAHSPRPFSCAAQAHLPSSGTTHSGLGLPISIISYENAPQTRPSEGVDSSTEVPSSQVCQVTRKLNRGHSVAVSRWDVLLVYPHFGYSFKTLQLGTDLGGCKKKDLGHRTLR